MASFFRRFNPDADAADDGGLPTGDGSSGPSWDWLDASAASSCDRAPGRAADAAWSAWAGAERLQSFAASRPAPLASPASSASAGSSSGASGATSPDPAIAADVASQEQNGSLSYNAVLTFSTAAAAGGMTASKFAALQSFAAELNAPGGISVTAYVQQITDDVI